MKWHLLVAIAISAPAISQAVLRVGAGQAFPDIGAAVAAASPGDRILIDAGTYGGFVLDKGVLLRPEPAHAQVNIGSFSSAIDCEVPVGQTALLEGLDLDGLLNVRKPVGQVAAGTISLIDVDSSSGITIDDAALALRGCVFLGGRAEGIKMTGAAVLNAVQCTIQGGRVSWFPLMRQGIAASGQSSIVASNCTITGGAISSIHTYTNVSSGVSLTGNAQASFVDSRIAAFAPNSFSTVVGLANASAVPVVLERTTTVSAVLQSPSVSGLVDNSLVLGLTTQTPLVRGSTFTLDFKTRPALPVVAHLTLQLATPSSHPAVAQKQWGFIANSIVLGQFVSDAQGDVSVSIAVPNTAWLLDLPVWFVGWSGDSLPVQLSPVLGGTIR